MSDADSSAGSSVEALCAVVERRLRRGAADIETGVISNSDALVLSSLELMFFFLFVMVHKQAAAM